MDVSAKISKPINSSGVTSPPLFLHLKYLSTPRVDIHLLTTGKPPPQRSDTKNINTWNPCIPKFVARRGTAYEMTHLVRRIHVDATLGVACRVLCMLIGLQSSMYVDWFSRNLNKKELYRLNL